MPTPGEEEVHLAAASREAGSFDEFFRDNYNAALSVAEIRTAGCDCEALVAEAFLLAWKHFQRTGQLSRGWLFGVIRNKIGDFYRSSRRREVPFGRLDHTARVEDASERSDLRVCVQRVLRSLPSTHSEPLLLVYWCDLSCAEAAQALGLREGALRVRLLRARRAFLKVLNETLEFNRADRKVVKA